MIYLHALQCVISFSGSIFLLFHSGNGIYNLYRLQQCYARNGIVGIEHARPYCYLSASGLLFSTRR